MPLVLPDGAPYPNAVVGWTGTIWQCLHVDAAGDLQVDVLDAAGLQGALQSIGTDRLIVRGEDQLQSFEGSLGAPRTAVISGAGGYVASLAVPANTVWVVTNIRTRDITSATTIHLFSLFRVATGYGFHENAAAFAPAARSYYHGWIWMVTDDVVRVDFVGGLAGDSCEVTLTGFYFTRET